MDPLRGLRGRPVLGEQGAQVQQDDELAAELGPGVALIAHLGHDVEAIGDFLDAMEAAAARLGMAPGTLAVAVHRMRGRLRELLRAEVRQLCTSAAEEAEELKHLMEVWSR